jgi:PAS domain S-box-containing protein
MPTLSAGTGWPSRPNSANRLLGDAGLALAYALLLAIESRFPTPFGPAAPIAPAAGLLLAAAAVWGLRCTVPLTGGLLLASAWAAPGQFHVGNAVSLAALLIQAALAARLMHASSRAGALLLETPTDLMRQLALPAACVGAAGAAAALLAARTVGAPLEPFDALARFAAELLGMVIVAPIALSLFGQPSPRWAARRFSLGLPLAFATLLLMTAFWAVARWDQQRAVAAFEAEARAVAENFEGHLHGVLDVVESMHGVMAVAGARMSAESFQSIARPWLERARGVRSVGWHQLISRDQQAAFEQQARSEGEAGFHVRNKPDGVSAELLAGDARMLVMRHTTSLQASWAPRERALGINILSIPGARDAALAALRENRAYASRSFPLIEQNDDNVAFVVYRPLQAAGEAPVGTVFATVFVARLIEPLLREVQTGLSLCIFDSDPAARQGVLSGARGCEIKSARADELLRHESVGFAGRQFELLVRTPLAAALRSAGAWNVWFLAGPGLMGAVLLTSLLLVNTGRVQRTEAEVRHRTEELRAQVDERRAAEEALLRSQRELRTVFDTVDVGVVQLDPNGNILDANPRYCELVGYRLDELRLLTMHDLTPSEFSAQDLRARDLLFGAGRGAHHIEKEYITRSGERVPVAVTVRAVLDSDGRPLYTVGAVRDLRGARRLQEAERVRDQAEAANRAKSEFVARMSHELRTPLNAILGFAQLLDVQGGERLSAGDRHWTGQIQKAGWHLLAMINDVLDLSRIEADTLELHMERLDLGELVETSVAMVAENAAQRGIAIRTELDPAAAAVSGDGVRLRQVLINLLSNAVKYNRVGGRILVRGCVPASGRVQIEVHDTGMGMDERQLGELFQPFNRLGQERTGVEGTGIGLAIAKRLAGMMGGELSARSVRGQGTVFTLTLAHGEEPVQRIRASSTEVAEPAAHAPACGRVLYIEDNEVNVEIMRAMLAARPGIMLDVAADGLDGLAAAHKVRPDLILLDHELPDIDGVEVLRRLGADPATADTPVIMVSADAMGEQVQAALAAGARSFLAKPVNLGALLKAVDDTLHAEDAGAALAAR